MLRTQLSCKFSQQLLKKPTPFLIASSPNLRALTRKNKNMQKKISFKDGKGEVNRNRLKSQAHTRGINKQHQTVTNDNNL